MSASITSSSSDLFALFQPRFRRIELVPYGFGNPFSGQQHQLYFEPKYLNGAKIHAAAYRGDGDNGNFAKFDVRAGKLDFAFRFNPEDSLLIGKQLDAAAAAAVFEGPLKDVEFYIDPVESFKLAPMYFKLSYSKEPIAGLIIPQKMTASWRFFIPEGSAEYQAIELALSIEANERLIEDAREIRFQGVALIQRKDQLIAELEGALKKAA